MRCSSKRCPRLLLTAGFFMMTAIPFFFAGCPSHSARTAEDTAVVETPRREAPAVGAYYTVREGDTLGELAVRYGVSAQRIAEVNNLKPPYVLNIDTTLFIPGAKETGEKRKSARVSEARKEVQDFRGLLTWPADGELVSEFGVRRGIQHNGIEIRAAEGTPVRAAAGGRIGHTGTIPGYGRVILIEHAGRLVTVYAHLAEIVVTEGETVQTGQRIGTVGRSGRAAEPALYFEVRSRSKPRNPLFFLNPRSSDPGDGFLRPKRSSEARKRRRPRGHA